MSSATMPQPGLVRRMLEGLATRVSGSIRPAETAQQTSDRIARLGLNARQQSLNYLWSWYRCEKYSHRRLDWNGTQAVGPIEHEAIATQGFLPPGFIDAGAQDMPVKFRRPTAPYPLGRVIVDRFTGLLFSEKKHPEIRVPGDRDTEEYANALATAGRLWALMILARAYGGSMGSACVGFQFVEGEPVIEIHDPRWMTPKFADRMTHVLDSIEKRYIYPQEERGLDGVWRVIDYWYRRIIDREKDVLFKPALVGEGDEPEWEVEKEVVHGFGFCPVVWTQNLPVQDSEDGDPDCHGLYEIFGTIDSLIAQANKGIIANCDPTAVIVSTAELSDVKKGSDNAIKLPDGSASYMEISGAGITAALALVDRLRGYALEVAQCILEHPEMSQRTATEIERAYSSMLSKADIFREQYGQKLIVPLIKMMIEAARSLTTTQRQDETGTLVRGKIILPPRVETDEETGQISLSPQALGKKSGDIMLQWPPYFEPLLADVELATRSAIAAQAGRLIDMEHAVKYVANYYQVEDAHAMIERIKSEAQQAQDQTSNQALGMLRGPGIPGEGYGAEGEGEDYGYGAEGTE